MKNDLSEAHLSIQKEKENSLHLEKVIKLLEGELTTAKRTIKTYRKVFLHMQREASSSGGLPLLNLNPAVNKLS